ncbi:hypothetical protein [Ectobacillus panaciterrae]|uniref:hypothetical protein n=1 Tax=Ectobacillus panaciterrae TaxID=363872 RepID=UPI0004127B33|nr:hypothetical protein [Ectobacillus panaciterrae]
MEVACIRGLKEEGDKGGNDFRRKTSIVKRYLQRAVEYGEETGAIAISQLWPQEVQTHEAYLLQCTRGSPFGK